MTKRPLYGMDTEKSAQRVKKRVVEHVRGEGRQPEMKRRPFILGASVLIGIVAMIFLIVQLQESAPSGKKLAMTALSDSLLVEVHQLTEENKVELGAENLNERENLADNKVLLVTYEAKKKPGEVIEVNFQESLMQFKERIAGPNNERVVTTSYSELNNVNDDTVALSYRLIFQTNGLSNEDIHKALREAKIELTHINLNQDKMTETFTLGQYAQFIGIEEQPLTDALPVKVVASGPNFLYQIEVKEPEIAAGEPFELTASLTYTGNRDEITITHGASPFYYEITEMTRNYEIDFMMEQPLVSTVLKKGEPLVHQYQLTGGYSDEDSPEFIDFMEQFLAGETPAGIYKVRGSVQFNIEGAGENEINASIQFNVK